MSAVGQAPRRGVFRGLATNASWRCRPPPPLRGTCTPSPDRLRQHSVSLTRRNIPAWRLLCAAHDDAEEVKDLGVNVALSMLKFYKREISPLLPSSCRYVPTCSEYSMQAYKRYGVVKGTILIAWRLCRCNPIGGYGYDPPRWFGEEDVPLQ